MNPNPPQYPAPGSPPPVAPARAGRGLTFALSDVIVAAAAVLFFVFSFTPLISVDTPSIAGFSIDVPSAHQNLWNFAAPLGWWTAIANLLALAATVAALWWPHDKEYVGFRRSQVQVAIGLWVFLFVLGVLFEDKAGASFGWGGYLMLLCSIALLAGAILGHLGMLQNPIDVPMPGGSTPGGSTPAAYPPPGAYQQPPTGYQPPPAGYQPPPAGYQVPAPGGYQAPAPGGYVPPQAPPATQHLPQPPHPGDTA